jgi:anti-sigma regulatory factor (Ser/Thr protein kinase)
MSQLLLINIQPENIPRAGDWVEAQCRSEGLSEMDSFKVKTCVVEGVNNAIEHVYGFRDGAVGIAVWREGGQFIVEISNDNIDRRPVDFGPPADAAPDSERGRGWLIINSWIDDAAMELRGGRTVLRLAKTIPV